MIRVGARGVRSVCIRSVATDAGRRVHLVNAVAIIGCVIVVVRSEKLFKVASDASLVSHGAWQVHDHQSSLAPAVAVVRRKSLSCGQVLLSFSVKRLGCRLQR